MNIGNNYATIERIRKKYNLQVDPQQPTVLQQQQGRTDTYQNRLNVVDAEPPKQGVGNFMLEAVNTVFERPRNAIWNAFEDVGKGENSFWQGLGEGWRQEENYTGADLMGDLGVEDKGAKFVGGMAAEIATDPFTYIDLGLGKKAVGFLRKGASKYGDEGVEAFVKAGMKNTGADVAKTTIKKTAGAGFAPVVADTASNKFSLKRAVDDLINKTKKNKLKYKNKADFDAAVDDILKADSSDLRDAGYGGYEDLVDRGLLTRKEKRMLDAGDLDWEDYRNPAKGHDYATDDWTGGTKPKVAKKYEKALNAVEKMKAEKYKALSDPKNSLLMQDKLASYYDRTIAKLSNLIM